MKSANKYITVIGGIALLVALAGDRLLIVAVPGVGDVPILDMVVAVLAIIGGLKYYKNRPSLDPLPLFIWWVGLFAVLAGVSLLGSSRWLSFPEIAQASLWWWRWVAYAGLIFWVSQLSAVRKKQLIDGLGIMWAVVALLGWLQLLIMPDLGWLERLGWDPHQHRMVSTFLDPNLLGGFLVFGLAFSLGQLTRPRASLLHQRRWGGLAALLFVSMIFTYSRSTLLALLVLGLLVSWRYWKIVLAGALVLLLVYSGSARLQERVQGALRLDVTVQYRLESWRDAKEIMQKQPWLGLGYNTLKFSRAEYQYQPHSRAATGFDSSLLTITATTGSVGLTVYLIWLISALAWVKQRWAMLAASGLPLAWGAGMGALLVHSLFVNSLLYPPIMAMGWIVLGLMWDNSRHNV